MKKATNQVKMTTSKALQQITKFEMYLIDKIVQRAARMAKKHGERLDCISLGIDICCAHVACPLKLNELLAAKDRDFIHDVLGIRRHINRITCELEDCFLPRYAMTDTELRNLSHNGGENAKKNTQPMAAKTQKTRLRRN